jgi:glutathione peroxidase
MRACVLSVLALAVLCPVTGADEKKGKKVEDIYGFTLKTIDGKDASLADYKGKAVLFVNVASFCGYTRQYTGLQELHEKYKDKGLVVVGVPANEFGSQEPGTDAEIKEFCSSKYSVTFPMLSKIVVKGSGIHPLYAYLTGTAKPAGTIGWNFEKILVGKNGKALARFKSSVDPNSEELTKAIDEALAK